MPNENKPDTGTRAAAAALIGLAVAAAATAGIVLTRDPEHAPQGQRKHAVIDWPDGGEPPLAATKCFRGTVRGSDKAWELLGLDKVDGGRGYAVAILRVVPVDGGTVRELPAGIEMLEPTEVEVLCEAGQEVLRVFTEADPVAPTGCACRDPVHEASLDAGVCEWHKPGGMGIDAGWVTAPPGMMLKSGEYRGGCRATVCGEWLGQRSMPTECCVGECTGRVCSEGLCGGNCGTCAEGEVCSNYACVPLLLDAGSP